MVEEYLGYTRKSRYSPRFTRLIWIGVVELCTIIVCFALELLGRSLDPVAGYHGPDLWVLALSMPFLLVIFFKMKGNFGKYYLLLDQIYDNVIIIPDRKRKKFKAITVFQIEGIPKNIVVKEERIRKKNIEKLEIPGTYQYIHDHLTLLAGVIPALSFEIRVIDNKIVLRIYNFLVNRDLDALKEEIEIYKQFTAAVFQTTFPGIQLRMLQGNLLRDAWADILGGYNGHEFKIRKDAVVIEGGRVNQFMAVMKMVSAPRFYNVQSQNHTTQIGELIRHVMGLKLDFHYVVSAESVQTSILSKQPQIAEKFELIFNEAAIRQQLESIRQSEVAGIWNTSSYIVIRSKDRDTLDTDISRMQSIFRNQFNTELSVLDSRSLRRVLPRLAQRAPLHDWHSLTSERLAILLHVPEKNMPSLSGSGIPVFDVPPELEVQSGVSVGTVLLNEQMLYPFHLNLEDLQSPILIAGDARKGKSTLSLNILKELTEKYKEVYWLIFDTKGEYSELQTLFPDQVKILEPYTPLHPFELNMFDPLKSNANEHSRKLLKILQTIFPEPFTDPIHQICLEVLKKAIKTVSYRNMESFIIELSRAAVMEKGNARTAAALGNLIEQLRDLRGSSIDGKRTTIDFHQLLQQKTILNLKSFNGGRNPVEQHLFMNLMFKYLTDYMLRRNFSNSLEFMLAVEDAHLISAPLLREVPETSYISDMPRLLVKYGVGLMAITARPERSIKLVENSDLKFIFKGPYTSKLIPISEKQEQYIQRLKAREAVVFLPRYPLLFRIFTKYLNHGNSTKIS